MHLVIVTGVDLSPEPRAVPCQGRELLQGAGVLVPVTEPAIGGLGLDLGLRGEGTDQHFDPQDPPGLIPLGIRLAGLEDILAQ